VHEAEKLSLEAIGRFVEASEEIRFESADRSQVYGWVERLLVGQEYVAQGKAARGLVRRYIEKMTGLSRAQVTRLIGLYTAKGRVQPTVYRRYCFPQRYTRADIELLASVDEAHETLSGPATRRILEREVQLYGKQEYARLAGISVAHLYNLRKSQRYRERRLNYVKTRPTTVSIGERRKPDPQPLLYASESLKLLPQQTLVVGDSINDVKAARAAGMPVICVTYGYNEGQDPHTLPCDALIDHLDELPGLLHSGA